MSAALVERGLNPQEVMLADAIAFFEVQAKNGS